MTKVPSVVSQHAEEAASLWLLRSNAVGASHYALSDLAKLDNRVEAHLDGLRIAGEDGCKICEEQLQLKEQGEVFVATALALAAGDLQRVKKVLKVVEEQPDLATGFISALGWNEGGNALPVINEFLASDVPTYRRIGITATAVRRQNASGPLKTALQDNDPFSKARACKAFGELGLLDVVRQLTSELDSEHSEVRFWAAWAVALFAGQPNALTVLKSAVETTALPRFQALEMGLRRMELGAAKNWQKSLSQNPTRCRLAVQGLGIIGDPELIPWLFPHMKVPPLARVAGEAFTMITGVDLAYHDLEGEWPEGFEAGPNEDPKDENVDMDPDENLPWPNPDLVQKWWEKNKGHFQNGVRYLCGKPMTIDWLKIVLRDGFQRQRAAAALELAIRQPGTPLFNVKAPGFRQIELLGKAKGPIRGPDHVG
jgi:uncharacterized protein (TIGR02270 family)